MTTIRRVWYVRRVHFHLVICWGVGLVCSLPTLAFVPYSAHGFIWFGLLAVVAAEVIGGVMACVGRKSVANCPICDAEIRIYSAGGGGYCTECRGLLVIRNGTLEPAPRTSVKPAEFWEQLTAACRFQRAGR